VFEPPGVEPFYHEKRQAVYYAEQRGRLGNAVVRIYDEVGNAEREIMPAPEDRMLYRVEELGLHTALVVGDGFNDASLGKKTSTQSSPISRRAQKIAPARARSPRTRRSTFSSPRTASARARTSKTATSSLIMTFTGTPSASFSGSVASTGSARAMKRCA
jgi:hypothetical protein